MILRAEREIELLKKQWKQKYRR